MIQSAKQARDAAFAEVARIQAALDGAVGAESAASLALLDLEQAQDTLAVKVALNEASQGDLTEAQTKVDAARGAARQASATVRGLNVRLSQAQQAAKPTEAALSQAIIVAAEPTLRSLRNDAITHFTEFAVAQAKRLAMMRTLATIATRGDVSCPFDAESYPEQTLGDDLTSAANAAGITWDGHSFRLTPGRNSVTEADIIAAASQ